MGPGVLLWAVVPVTAHFHSLWYVTLVFLVDLILLGPAQDAMPERADGVSSVQSSVSLGTGAQESQDCGDKWISQAKCLLQWNPSYWAGEGCLRPMGTRGFPGLAAYCSGIPCAGATQLPSRCVSW